FFGTLVPVVLLIILSAINNKVLNYDNFWLPFMGVVVLMFTALFYAIRASKAAIQNQIIFAVLIAVCLGYGSVMQINSGFDKSPTELFVTSVVGKYITYGRSNSYHLVIIDWANHSRRKNVRVGSYFYKRTKIGSDVDVHLRRGFLNVPYFYVTK
ncbi:MAG TPA: hypothetical protein VGC01_11970, partial [Mucilaginibacter sp.]